MPRRRLSSAHVPAHEQVEQKDAYDTHIKPLDGAPEYDPSLLIYARYRPFPGETWATYKDRIDMSMAGAEAVINLRRAIWEPKKFEGIEYPDDDVKITAAEVIDVAIAKTDDRWCPETENALAAEVLERLAFLLPDTNLAPPATLDPSSADFVWATARCVFAGAGYSAQAAIVSRLLATFPSCPFSTDDSFDEWETAVDVAHRACGVPASLAWTPWADLVKLPDIPPDTLLPFWLLWRAWIHVLTHVRLEQSEPYIRVYYRGVARLSTFTNSNKLGDWQNKNIILTNLGCPPQTSKKHVHPLTKAVHMVLRMLPVHRLLPVRKLLDLPGQVLWGKWSTLVPVAGHVGFADHGHRLSGVWLAQSGVIGEHDGGDDDIVGYEWNITNPHDKDVLRAREMFDEALPKTYAEAWPADVLLAAFPNLNVTHHKDPVAWKAVLDHVVFASLMRDQCDFSREFPLVCALPSMPSADASTNQGKTAFAQSMARAMMPAVDVVKCVDSGSAPDMRACAEKIRARGTACLDEWYPPINKGHLLSRDNLQTLCTGGMVLAGRVMENTAEGLSLKHSLTISSKALDFAPDLVNRSLFFYLDELSPTQRADAGMIRQLENGTIALLMRLGALAYLERHNLVNLYNTFSKPGGAYRFPGHRTLASILYGIRCTETGTPGDPDAIDRVILEMRARHGTHTRDADEYGTLASLESGKELRLRLANLFHELTGRDLEHMRTWMGAHADRPGSMAGSPSKLLRAWLSLRDSAEAPLGSVVQFLSGRSARVSDRLVSNLVTEEIRATIGTGTAWILPGLAGAEGWVLKRHADRAKSLSVSLERIAKLATGEITVESVVVED